MGRPIERNSEAGVTLIEVMMSGLILTTSLMAIAMTLTQGISAMYFTQEQLIAKQKSREALESVFTARSTQDITFDQIRNTDTDPGIFLTDFQPIRGMGTDGIANTADDASENIEEIRFPGPDGNLGTADDEIRPLTAFERKITITNLTTEGGGVDVNLRKIVVEVRFKSHGVWQSVSVGSYISRFA